MMNCFRYLLPALIILAQVSTACGQKSRGELNPHFGKSTQYLGNFHGNFGYMIKSEDNSTQLKGGEFVVSVKSASEKFLTVIRRPTDGYIAVIERGDARGLRLADLTPSELKFQAIAEGTKILAAWNRATNPGAFKDKTKKGERRKWIYVDSDVLKQQTDRFYVSAGVQLDPKTKLQIAEILVVSEESFLLFINPDKNKFAPVATNLFGSPLDKAIYENIPAGSMAAKVLEELLKGTREPTLQHTANKIDLNSLSRAEYREFKAEIQTELAKAPQASAKKAKQILIGLMGLEERPNAHSMFDIDPDFTVQSLLALVASANKIKLVDKELTNFKLLSVEVRPKLSSDIQKKYLDVLTALILLEQSKL